MLPRPDRVSGRRVYGPDTVRTLAVIETGQRAGLTLGEIRDLLSAFVLSLILLLSERLSFT